MGEAVGAGESLLFLHSRSLDFVGALDSYSAAPHSVKAVQIESEVLFAAFASKKKFGHAVRAVQARSEVNMEIPPCTANVGSKLWYWSSWQATNDAH